MKVKGSSGATFIIATRSAFKSAAVWSNQTVWRRLAIVVSGLWLLVVSSLVAYSYITHANAAATAVLTDCEADMQHAREIVQGTDSMASGLTPPSGGRFDAIAEFDRLRRSDALEQLAGDCHLGQQQAFDAEIQGLWKSLFLFAALPIPLGLLLAGIAGWLSRWVRGASARA